MSVKLSELKVPPNAIYSIREHFKLRLADPKVPGRLSWMELSALAVLYWLAELRERNKNFGRMEYDDAIQEVHEAVEQIDLWQRAAFEGVEP